MMGGMAGAKEGMGGGMGAGMGEMMKEMGKPPKKALYPSMMQSPEVSPERRAELGQLADERVNEARALLAAGLEDLKEATRTGDFAAAEEANAQIRYGQQVLQSGLAAQQTLATNQNPQSAAFRWFAQNMNLAPAVAAEPRGLFGLSWFHLISMLTLVVFAAAVIGMYFQKMRRANALVARLVGNGPGSVPPPGGSPSVPTEPPAPKPAPPSAPATPATLPAVPGPTAVAGLTAVAGPAAVAGATAGAAPAAPNPGLAALSTSETPSKPNAWTGTLLVSEIFEETPQVKTFRLTDAGGGKLPFLCLPGQFLSLTVIPDGTPVSRSYTIASSPTHREYCELTVKHEEQGIVSGYLHTQVHVGELLQLLGPSGRFTFTEHEADSLVLIAGGVGITPLMSVIRYLTDHSWKKDIFLFFTCKNESSIIFREEIEYLRERHPNLHVWITLTRPGHKPKAAYHSGRLTKETLAEHAPDLPSRRVHICGPPPMIAAMQQMLDELKVPKENIRVEIFTSPPPASKELPSAPEELPPAPEAAAALPATAEAVVPEALPPPPLPTAASLPAPPIPEAAGPPPAPPPAAVALAAAVPAAPATTASATMAVVTFVKSNKTAVLTPDKSVLEASEDVGVNIDYSCRVGTCGICKTKMLSGQVTMAVQDALTAADKANNIILACQAKATADVAVDA